MGARMWPGFAGVIIVEARKELMGAIPKAVAANGRRQPVPAAEGVSPLATSVAAPDERVREGSAPLT
jgi:hypothetical protein